MLMSVIAHLSVTHWSRIAFRLCMYLLPWLASEMRKSRDGHEAAAHLCIVTGFQIWPVSGITLSRYFYISLRAPLVTSKWFNLLENILYVEVKPYIESSYRSSRLWYQRWFCSDYLKQRLLCHSYRYLLFSGMNCKILFMSYMRSVNLWAKSFIWEGRIFLSFFLSHQRKQLGKWGMFNTIVLNGLKAA